ncbi:germ cell nuclear acidic protein [Glossophaga mutica]
MGVARRTLQNGSVSFEVIDLDSDDNDEQPPEKHENTSKVTNQGETREVSSDSGTKYVNQEMPIVISDDDDSDVEDPVIIEDSSSDDDQIASIKKEMMQFTISPPVVKGQKRTRSLEEVPQPQPKRKRTQPSKRKGTESAEPPSKKKRAEPPSKRKRAEPPSKKKRAEPPSKRKRAEPPKKKPRAVKSPQPPDQHEHEYLPEKLDICWNKKMLRTAGLCSSTHSSNPKKRYTKIDISLKVCDSADRIRDTLAHELCHAASWLLNGIRASHGYTWRYYARKCNLAHPELPLVTRFHNYKINYKIYYECTRCKARIGRYSRSLNTERSACPSCKGRLVLLPLTRKDGTPIKPHVRPFAKYVKYHYRIVRQGMTNATHGDVMRQLSKDYFICKENNTL